MKKHLEVIPAVLSKTGEDMMRRISLVSPYVKIIHMDMMDGKFVPNTTLSTEETAKILRFSPNKAYIFHWMAERPEEEIPKLGETLVKTSLHLVHVEVLTKKRWGALKKIGVQLGIAINPETALAKIYTYGTEKNGINDFLVMSVHPGFSNQKYISDVEKKIKELRKQKPNANIEVDGGIGVETAGGAAGAGANRLAAASAIFSKEDVGKAIKDIKKAAERGSFLCSKK